VLCACVLSPGRGGVRKTEGRTGPGGESRAGTSPVFAHESKRVKRPDGEIGRRKEKGLRTRE